MPITLTIILKDSERTYRHKFLIYEEFSFNLNDEVINKCIKEAKDSFGNDADDVYIKAQFEIQ